MAIIQTVGFTEFLNAFYLANRQDQFTYEGKRKLFDYLEQCSEDTGESVELDVVGLCCDYAEMTYDEIRMQYSEASELDDESLLDWLNDHTVVVGHCSGNIIFAHF